MDSLSVRQDALFQKYTKIASVVALYWFVSISMVFINKTLLGGSSMGQGDAPLFITWFQCFVTVIACVFLTKLSKFFPNLVKFPDVGQIDSIKAKQVLPLTCVFIGMITMNNLCLKYVGVAFYYVGRSLTTVFNVMFSYILLGQKTSMSALVCCGIIIGGFMLGIDQEKAAGSLSVLGVIYGLLAAMCVALNSIFTKKVLPVVDNSVWVLTFYNNVLACILFMPLIFVTGELSSVMVLVSEGTLHFWTLMVVGGICGFAIGYVTGLQIQVTSPLTHMISGTAKACAQTIMATWWFSESKATLWWASNAIVLLGSMSYTRVKQLEMKASHAAPVPQASDTEKLTGSEKV